MDRTSKLLIGIGIAGSACGDYNMILIKIPVKLATWKFFFALVIRRTVLHDRSGLAVRRTTQINS